jgi:hypothetical protein
MPSRLPPSLSPTENWYSALVKFGSRPQNHSPRIIARWLTASLGRNGTAGRSILFSWVKFGT